LLQAGIDYAVIEKLLGHRLHGMGEGYIHNWEHRLREAVLKLEDILARKLSGTAEGIEQRVGSCGQLGSYENFKFPKWWILWCRGTESNCRHQPFQGIRKTIRIKKLRKNIGAKSDILRHLKTMSYAHGASPTDTEPGDCGALPRQLSNARHAC
jgi:hypothetical protein